MNQTPHRTVVVLGMHRSGTSLVTRSLGALGVCLGADLLEPMENVNPVGFFEHKRVVDLDRRLLDMLGRAWNTLDMPTAEELTGPVVAALHNEAVQLVRQEGADRALWAFKDPRACRLLPFWQRAIRQAGRDPVYLLVLRNPLDVAHSLAVRNEYTLSYSLLLWLTHVQGIVNHLDRPALVVSYEAMLDAPQRQLERMAAFFGLSLPAQSESIEMFLETFHRPDLCHHRSDVAALEAACTGIPLVPALYRHLAALTDRGAVAVREWQAIREMIAPAEWGQIFLRAHGRPQGCKTRVLHAIAAGRLAPALVLAQENDGEARIERQPGTAFGTCGFDLDGSGRTRSICFRPGDVACALRFLDAQAETTSGDRIHLAPAETNAEHVEGDVYFLTEVPPFLRFASDQPLRRLVVDVEVLAVEDDAIALLAPALRGQFRRLRQEDASLRQQLGRLQQEHGRLLHCCADRAIRLVSASQMRFDWVMTLTAPLRAGLRRLVRQRAMRK